MRTAIRNAALVYGTLEYGARITPKVSSFSAAERSQGAPERHIGILQAPPDGGHIRDLARINLGQVIARGLNLVGLVDNPRLIFLREV